MNRTTPDPVPALPPAVAALLEACIAAEIRRDRWNETYGDEKRYNVVHGNADRARAALASALAPLVRDAARYRQLDLAYCAADFADEQFPGRVLLKFALPIHTRVCGDLAATLDSAAARTPEEADADAQ